MDRMKEKSNWRGIGSLVVITVCLVSVMSPAMTQSSFSLFNNASTDTDGETEDMPTPSSSPTQTPTPEPTPVPSHLPTPTPSPAAPNITSFTPDSPVYDIESATRTFSIAMDQAVNVSWLLNGTEVQTDKSVTGASYTNTSVAVGIWNVSALATNENGSVFRTWIWKVSSQATPTPTPGPTPSPTPASTKILSSNVTLPSTPFMIYGYVSYKSGSACHAPFVIVTNLNTSEEFIAGNNTNSSFYQLVMNSTYVNAGDVLQIEASKNGTLIGNATHTVTQYELNRGIIQMDIGEKLPDLILSNISTPPYTLKDEKIEINVTVCNNENASSGPFTVNLSVNGLRDEKQVFGLDADSCTDINFSWTPTVIGNYTITALADSKHEICELNESNNRMSKPILVRSPDLTVTKIEIETGCGSFEHPCYRYPEYALNITAAIENLGDPNASDFVVKFYDDDSLFDVQKNISLPAGSCLPVNASWNLSNARIGDHIITVEVDPCSNPDSNPTNNTNSIKRRVKPPWGDNDPYILPVSVSPPPKGGDNVTINVSITNKGPRSANLLFNFSCLDRYNREIPFDNAPMHIDANSTNYTEAVWNARPLFITQDYLFSMGGELEPIKDDLNKGTVPGRLKNLFDIHAVPLSEGIIVTNNTDEWTIIDEGNNNTYIVREKGGELNVYFPKGITTTRIINVKAVNARGLDTTKEINVALPNLTITDIRLSPPHPAYNEHVNVTVTIKNNENRTVNATLWFYDVNNTAYKIPYKSSKSTFPISYPAALGMGVHFKNLIIETDEEEGKEGFVNVTDREGNIILKFAPPIACQENPYEYGSVWTKWGSGGNITINHSRLYGKKEGSSRLDALVESVALLNESVVTLNASEGETNFTLNYNFTQRGIHTLGVILSNGNKISKTIGGVDLAVNLSVNETVYDGDILNITTTIENLGYVNASEFIVTVSNDSIPLYTEKISGLSGAQFYPDNTWNVTIPWNATTWNATAWEQGAHTRNHTIKVEIPREENENIESCELNNCVEKTTQVKPSRDFTVTNITTLPAEQKLETGINIRIKAVVWNFGNRRGSTRVNFSISNIDGEERFFNSTTSLLDSETNETVSINWTADIGGNCVINVTVDPYNVTWELNEINNSMTKQKYINASDLVVKNLHIDPTSPIQGNTSNINATVRNTGDKDAENITVRFEAKLLESTHERIWCRNTTIPLLRVNDSQDVSPPMPWNASHAGKYEITVVADPDGQIPELIETNNETAIWAIVQGPDLIISNFSLLRADGTEISKNDTIARGENVTIIVNVSNMGVLPAAGFNVSFIDNCNDNSTIIPDTSISISGLGENQWIEKSTIWQNVSIGDHEIIAVADSDDNIYETTETNNTMERRLMVRGADLLISNITFTVISPPGKNASTNLTRAIFDTDNVSINARIKNQGILPAGNFTVEMFNGYKLEDYNASGEYGSEEVHRYLEGARAIYVHLSHIKSGDKVRIYENGDYTEMDNTGWHLVMGDNVRIWINTGLSEAKLHFYAGDVKYEDVRLLNPNNATHRYLNVSVNTGDYLCRIEVDTKNNVTEHNEGNNATEKPMHVLPSIDFTVADMRLFLNETEIGANETISDGDTITVNATVKMGINESDPYNETRKGSTDVDVIDEHGWVYTSPRYELTPHGYCYNISYPGADALRVHFNELSVSDTGFVELWNKQGNKLTITNSSETISPWVDGETIYVCKGGKPSILTPCIICSIDIYQYRKVNRTTNLTFAANEDDEKEVNTTWNNVSAGYHTIRAITDPDNKTGEINESNNELNKPLIVTPCKDPAVVNITFDPPSPVPRNSKNISVTACIKNKGTKTANFSVDLWAYKSERCNYESPHYKDIPQEGFTKTITTYPEADWTGVHFTNITLHEGSETRRMHIDDKTGNTSEYYHSFNGENIWAWVKGGTLEITMPVYDPNPPWLDGGSGSVWGCSFDEVAHKIILNHTFITLGPGNTTNVSGTLPEMRIGNDSTSYTIYAAVDMDNVVYETDETNNEMVKTLGIRVPDLTVSKIECEGGKPRAIIKNEGGEEAKNVTVRFQRDVDKLEPRWEIERWGSDIDSLSQEGADIMRVHVEYLNVKEDENGSLEITNGTLREFYTEDDYDGFWSPWMGVDSVTVTPSINLIWNDVNKYRIDKYEYGVDKDLGNFTAGRSEKEDVPVVEGAHSFTPVNVVYTLTVIVDAENEPIELKGNNKKEKTIGPDISVIASAPRYLLVDYPVRISATINNSGTLPAKDFKVTLYANITDDMEPVETRDIDYLFIPGHEEPIEFEWKPLVEKTYNFTVIADPEGVVGELDKNNNEITPFSITAFGRLGYDGSSLEGHIEGEVNGGVFFEIGDRADASNPDQWYAVCKYDKAKGKFRFEGGDITNTDSYRAKWNVTIPEVKEIGIARLYLYWGYSYIEQNSTLIPKSPKVEMEFKGISEIPFTCPTASYLDYPVAEDVSYGKNYAYGTYRYDVGNVINTNGDNFAAFTISGINKTCIAGMGLLVIYKGGEEVLTKYWIREGADVLLSGATEESGLVTPLCPDKCTTEVQFDGCVEHEGLGNATLTTVVPWGNGGNEKVMEDFFEEGCDGKWKDKKKNGLYFFNGEINNGVWVCDSNRDAIGIDEREVRDLVGGRSENVFGIQDRGDFMVSANAFLVATYPPDLVKPYLPKSVVVGKSIPVVVRNTGRSDAKDFNVSFWVDGVFKGKIEHVNVKALSERSPPLTFPWTPYTVGQVVVLNVSVDSDNDVSERDENNNNASQLVTVVPMTQLAPGGESISAWKEGFGPGEGPGEGAGAGTTVGEGGKSAMGETGGKTITGRLMKGTVAQSEEGGGGKVEFSILGLLMRLALFAAAGALVCVGYLLERKRQNNKPSLEKKV